MPSFFSSGILKALLKVSRTSGNVSKESSILMNGKTKELNSFMFENFLFVSWFHLPSIHFNGGRRFNIDRAPECALVLNNSNHAVLFAENSIVRVADLKSTNGIFLNGECVPQGGSGGLTGITLGNTTS